MKICMLVYFIIIYNIYKILVALLLDAIILNCCTYSNSCSRNWSLARRTYTSLTEAANSKIVSARARWTPARRP
jgi:hypothetical protein